MKLQRLHIKNFKSIVDLKIVEPNPFTVFVGPNGSGKSNIFEALEFLVFIHKESFFDVIRKKGGAEKILNCKNFEQNLPDYQIDINCILDIPQFKEVDDSIYAWVSFYHNKLFKGGGSSKFSEIPKTDPRFLAKQFIENFSRLFIRNIEIETNKYSDDLFLTLSASNLEKVLKRILLDENKREEIKEWLDLFIPGFENIEIVSSDLSGTDTLVMYEKGIKKPFTKDLLSDGTYNILALLTAIYQSDEPQFLCIEEPENGLNPYVIRKLVDFFRAACEEKGHYIWLNTHSNALVECLTPEEVVVVDKIGGETKIKQIKGMNLHGLNMAEVWLSGALGGGTPW